MQQVAVKTNTIFKIVLNSLSEGDTNFIYRLKERFKALSEDNKSESQGELWGRGATFPMPILVGSGEVSKELGLMEAQWAHRDKMSVLSRISPVSTSSQVTSFKCSQSESPH